MCRMYADSFHYNRKLLDFGFPKIAKFAHAQDGLLRVFHYDSMELVGAARSYFGGLLCAAWSPDGKYIVAGGEDDLVTVYRYSGIIKTLW
jgi:hypothetical protein